MTAERSTHQGEPALPATPHFFYDFASPWCWLAAEHVNHMLPIVPVWQPVPRAEPQAVRRRPGATERADLALRAVGQGLPAPRLPDPWPDDVGIALRAAIFAQASGRVVAFSLAALRQAFAGARDLSQVDNVLIAAAACELHPRAVLKGIESRVVARRIGLADEQARSLGVTRLPAIAAGSELWAGPDCVERAAEALAAVF